MARRKTYLFVCVNRRPDGTPKGSCAARGSVELHAQLKARLKERGLAELSARPCSCSCLDACWVGPVIAVAPGDFFYGRVQLSDVDEIVDSIESGRRVERLILQDEDFIEPRELKHKPSESLKKTTE